MYKQKMKMANLWVFFFNQILYCAVTQILAFIHLGSLYMVDPLRIIWSLLLRTCAKTRLIFL